MKLENEVFIFKIRKIVRKIQKGRPTIYNLYLSVMHTYDSKAHPLKENPIPKTPTCIVTSNYMLPFAGGYKAIEDFKVGDMIVSKMTMINLA